MLALYIVVGIVLFIVLILSIPIEMAFDTRRPGAKARVGWAFGLLWKDVGGGKKKPKRPKKKKKRPGAKTFRDVLANRVSVNGLLKLARRIIGGIRVKQLDVHLRMGLDDSSGPHHQDSGEAKIRESTAGVSRKPSSDGKACGCSSKHLCGLTAWST